MPTAPPAPIADLRALERACVRLAEAPFLAVDTEFHRERTFFAQLCLVQVASADEVVLIDPLALRDLTPLRDLLMLSGIVKVFHAARQDLEIFHDLWEAVPAPIFDTQVAAGVLGLGHQVGYARLVEQLLDVRLEKAGTLTDWARRPLAQDQVRYAADDVVHLAAAYPALLARLKEQGREDWLAPEMKALADPSQFTVDPDAAWRTVRGAGAARGPARLAVRALAAWREDRARARNIPRRWVLADEALVEIARRRPSSREDLSRVRGLSARFLDDQADQLLEVIAGIAAEPDQAPEPRARRISPEAETLADLMQCLVRLRARERGVAATQLATREQLELVAELGEEAQATVLEDWRREVVGEDLLALRDGRLRLVVVDRQVTVERA